MASADDTTESINRGISEPVFHVISLTSVHFDWMGLSKSRPKFRQIILTWYQWC